MLDGCGLAASSWAFRAPRARCTIWSWRSPSSTSTPAVPFPGAPGSGPLTPKRHQRVLHAPAPGLASWAQLSAQSAPELPAGGGRGVGGLGTTGGQGGDLAGRAEGHAGKVPEVPVHSGLG